MKVDETSPVINNLDYTIDGRYALFDIDVTANLLSAIDEFECFKPLFEAAGTDQEIQVVLGEDLGPKLNGPYGFVYIKYHTPLNLTGEVGVLGPARLNYNYIVPTVRYFGELIGEIAKGW